MEQENLTEFLPDYKTVIVLAHHIKHSLEWTWFPFDSSRNGTISPADLHLTAEAQKIITKLEKDGYQYSLIPYPGKKWDSI